jgi:hypothetical protein
MQWQVYRELSLHRGRHPHNIPRIPYISEVSMKFTPELRTSRSTNSLKGSPVQISDTLKPVRPSCLNPLILGVIYSVSC